MTSREIRVLWIVGVSMLLAGSILYRIGSGLTNPSERPGVQILLLLGGPTLAGVGALLCWLGFRSMRERAKLARRDDLVAEWRVTPDEWQAFALQSRARDADPGALRSAVSVDMAVPEGGLPVVVTTRAVQVGDHFHELGTIGTEVLGLSAIDAPVPMLEFEVRQMQSLTTISRHAVRIPVSAAARQRGQAVLQHWQARDAHIAANQDQFRTRRNHWWRIASVATLVFLPAMGLSIFNRGPDWLGFLAGAAGLVATVTFFAGVSANAKVMR